MAHHHDEGVPSKRVTCPVITINTSLPPHGPRASPDARHLTPHKSSWSATPLGRVGGGLCPKPTPPAAAARPGGDPPARGGAPRGRSFRSTSPRPRGPRGPR